MQPVNARRSLLTATLLVVLVACSQQESRQAAAAAAQDTVRPEGAVVSQSAPAAPQVSVATPSMEANKTEAAAATVVAPAAQLTSSAASYSDPQHKFIRTAHAEFRVRDVYNSALAIEDIAAAQGGFVINNDISAQTMNVQTRPEGDGKLTELDEYTMRGALVVRVPSDHTQAFLRAIAGQIDFLDRRQFEATDAQFDLLRQQLAQQRGEEEQQELAQANQQGGKLDQRLEVVGARNEAKSTRDDALIAQKQYEDKIAFSTIDLSIYQTPRIRATEMVDVDAEFQRNSPGFLPRLQSSLGTGWAGLLDVVVTLASVWPLWLVLLVVAALLRYFAKRRRAA